MEKNEIGKMGERLGKQYLINKGCKIIEKNFWRPWGELDIIVTAPDKTLIFVEVKTIQHKDDNLSIKPEDNLTRFKLKKLQRTASLYANSHPELIDDNRGWRIDLLAIDMLDNEKFAIRHYENI